MKTELKPCPFCGGEVYTCDEPVDANTTVHHFICSNCNMTAYFDYLDEEESNEAWNRREPIDRIVEQLEDEKEKALELCDGNSRYKGYTRAIEIVKGGVE